MIGGDEDDIIIEVVEPVEPESFTNLSEDEFASLLNLKDGIIISQKISKIVEERNSTLRFLNAILGNQLAQQIAQGLLLQDEVYLNTIAIEITRLLYIGDLTLDLCEDMAEIEEDEKLQMEVSLFLQKVQFLYNIEMGMSLDEATQKFKDFLYLLVKEKKIDAEQLNAFSDNIDNPEVLQYITSLQNFLTSKQVQ